MADNDDDYGNAGALEQDTHKLQDDEYDEFLDGSHSNKNVAGLHSDRHHHLTQQDASRADDPLSGPTSTLATPAEVAPAPATPAISKEMLQVEVELRLLEALEIYQPAKLQGIHRHFILYGLMEYLERRLNHHFSSDDVLELLERFYNLDLLAVYLNQLEVKLSFLLQKPDEEESELLSQEEDFSLPASILSIKEELKENS